MEDDIVPLKKFPFQCLKKPAWVLGVLAVLLLSGCAFTYTPSENDEEENPGSFLLESKLFEETETDGEGFVTTRLHTNDPKYWSFYGYTLWTVWGGEEPEDPLIERTVMMSKAKGDMKAGYGLVLCQGTDDVETMLVVMINNLGEYAVGKVINGRYGALTGWTIHESINSGLGAPNEIKLSSDGNAYVVLANGFELTRFEDADEPRLRGGRNGYVVVISPLDRFPSGEVDVYFTEKK